MASNPLPALAGFTFSQSRTTKIGGCPPPLTWDLATPPRLWTVPPERVTVPPTPRNGHQMTVPPSPGGNQTRGPKPDLATTTPLQPEENFLQHLGAVDLWGKPHGDCATGGGGGCHGVGGVGEGTAAMGIPDHQVLHIITHLWFEVIAGIELMARRGCCWVILANGMLGSIGITDWGMQQRSNHEAGHPLSSSACGATLKRPPAASVRRPRPPGTPKHTGSDGQG